MIVGIDLGTTNSAVARIDGSEPKLIPNSLGDLLTPSVIGLDHDDNILVGKAAVELAVSAPDRCASMFKRKMGLDWECRLGKRKYSAFQLSGLVLLALKSDAECALNTRIEDAVITVPAYFNDDQRRATIEAGRLAGLNVRRIINEPTAASLAYGIHKRDEERTVAIFDLGGGTFDVSIVDFFEGAIEVRASAGESILGGEDFTRALAHFVLSQHNLVFEQIELRHPKMLSRLIRQCEIAKRNLSESDHASVRLPNPDGSFEEATQPFELKRDDLHRCCEKLIARIELPIRRALADAKITREEVDDVILAGGSTRMPLVSQLVNRVFNRPPLIEINPDHVVAMGAAIQAALLEKSEAVDDMIVTDVAPLLTRRRNRQGNGREFAGRLFPSHHQPQFGHSLFP